MNAITTRSRGASPTASAATDTNGRSADSIIAQKPVISVHIVPAGEGLPPIHIEPHERSAKKIVDTLREIYGSGNLLDPMGMCVIPRSQRYLAPGYYTFERNPRVSMESRKFEAAGMMEAISAAEYYQYAFVDGHENASLAPVTSKSARSSALATRALCGKRSSDQAASKKLGQRHEMQLRRLGTNMGSAGHQVLDLRARDDMLRLLTDQHRYTGGFDFALVPRGVSEKEVAGHIRVGFVHHWSGMSKDEYAAALQSQDWSTGRVGEDWLEGSHPRAILGLLAARSEQEEEAPMDVVVTDGAVFDILRCNGSDVLMYRGLLEGEAYYALSQALEQDARVKPAHMHKQDAGVYM